jgi:hypothetical protein
MNKKVLDVKGTAALLTVAEDTVYDLFENGEVWLRLWHGALGDVLDLRPPLGRKSIRGD